MKKVTDVDVLWTIDLKHLFEDILHFRMLLNLVPRLHLRFHPHLASDNLFDSQPAAFLGNDFAKYAKVLLGTKLGHSAYRNWLDHPHREYEHAPRIGKSAHVTRLKVVARASNDHADQFASWHLNLALQHLKIDEVIRFQLDLVDDVLALKLHAVEYVADKLRSEMFWLDSQHFPQPHSLFESRKEY